jgi:predicted N-acetyltransferase YhbS
MQTIRVAIQSDIPALAELWRERMVLLAQQDGRIGFSGDGTESIAQWLNTPECLMLVTEQDTQIMGFIVGSIQQLPPGVQPACIGVVYALALDMHRNASGTAQALLTAVREKFHEQGATACVVVAPRRSAVEQAFWRSQGATEWIDVLWMK